MFNKDFYPTPDDLIRKMLVNIKHISNMNKILEPSAGKGNILDYIFKAELSHYYNDYRKQEVQQQISVT